MLSKFCVSMMQVVVGTTKFSGVSLWLYVIQVQATYMHTVDMYTMSQKSVLSLTGYRFNTHLKWVEMAEMMLFLRHCYSVMGASSTSVVRYPRYLDTYRQYLGDDTSIAKVMIYCGISWQYKIPWDGANIASIDDTMQLVALSNVHAASLWRWNE